MSRITKSRRRRVIAGIASTFVVAAVAMAAWAAIDIIEGEGSTTAGKAANVNVPINVAFVPSEGFTPEPTGTCAAAMTCAGGEFVNAVMEAPTGTTAHETTTVTGTITDTKEGSGCPASSFILVGDDPGSKEQTVTNNVVEEKTAVKLPAGKSTTALWKEGNVKIEVTESAPQACE